MADVVAMMNKNNMLVFDKKEKKTYLENVPDCDSKFIL